VESVLTAALPRIRRETGLEVAFGGMVDPGEQSFRITRTAGGTTHALDGLRIQTREGLGGVVLAQGRPASVPDYVNASQITHLYDLAVSSEHLRSIVAVPILLHGSVRAVLYGAFRKPTQTGSRVAGALQRISIQASFDLAVAEETRRKIRALETTVIMREARESPTQPEWEAVRVAHAELRELAMSTHDAELKQRLTSIVTRLSGPTDSHAPRLSARELDVLALVAIGETNSEIATRLGLEPETVKSYLRNSMRKLAVHRRIEAVARARSVGLLP